MDYALDGLGTIGPDSVNRDKKGATVGFSFGKGPVTPGAESRFCFALTDATGFDAKEGSLVIIADDGDRKSTRLNSSHLGTSCTSSPTRFPYTTLFRSTWSTPSMAWAPSGRTASTATKRGRLSASRLGRARSRPAPSRGSVSPLRMPRDLTRRRVHW